MNQELNGASAANQNQPGQTRRLHDKRQVLRISGGSGDQSTEKVLSERKLEYGKRSLNIPSVGLSDRA